MEVNNTELKKSSWQASYILVALVLVLFSYGCAIFRGLSESEVQSEQSPPVVFYQKPTDPVVSDSPTLVKNENSRPVFSSKKALSKEEIRQIQARLKAAGFDPGPIDGILGSKTRSLILRVEAGCTILNELATANGELFAPAAETQARCPDCFRKHSQQNRYPATPETAEGRWVLCRPYRWNARR